MNNIASKLSEAGFKVQSNNRYSVNNDLNIVIKNNNIDFEKMKEIFKKHAGQSKVFFEITQNNKTKRIQTNYMVNNNTFLITELVDKIGNGILIRPLT